MRITFLLETAYVLYGSIQATLTAASALAARGHAVEVVSVFRHRTAPRHPFDPAVPVVSLVDLRGSAAGGRGDAAPEAPSAILPEELPIHAPYSARTDAVVAEHLAGSRADVVISAWPAMHYHLAELAPASAIRVAHDHLLYDYHPPRARETLRRAYSRIDAVVAVAATAAEGYRRHFPELAGKIHYIPNAIPPLLVPRSRQENPLVLAAGRLTPNKRFDLLIEAFARVVAEHPEWRLRIYGHGPERERLRALVRALGLYDHVALPGSASPMDPEWAKGSIGAVTSDRESFGLVILEAMQAGLPVVATDCPVGPRELIDHGVDGLLVGPGDVGSIATGLARLVASSELRETMAAAAVEKAERFSAERIAARHEELYASLLRAGDRAAGTGTAEPVRAAAEHSSAGGLTVTCTSRSATELELTVEGAGAVEEALLTHGTRGETLRIEGSRMGRDAMRFPIALDRLPAVPPGTWHLTVAGRAPRLKLIDNRALVAQLDAGSGAAEALLPVDHDGELKIHAITVPCRAQLTALSWTDRDLSVAGVLLGDDWGETEIQIDTAAGGSKRFAAPCRNGGGGFRCRLAAASAYAALGVGDGSWRVWLADAANPSRRVPLGKMVSDLRNPAVALQLPGATVAGPAGEGVHVRPRYSANGLLTLAVSRVDAPSSLDAVAEPAEADPARRR